MAQDAEFGGVRVTRLALDRRITSALRPLPMALRRVLARVVGMDPEAVVLPADGATGFDRLRYPFRRLLEVAAQLRRVGPWTEAVVQAAPDTEVFHTQALMTLPVVRGAARRIGGRYVYDYADYLTEAGRIARMPRFIRAFVRRREHGWARGAAGMLAASEPIAELVAQHSGAIRPSVVLNCPPAWRPDEPGPPTSTRLRDALRLPTDRQIVLYHGQLKPDRGLVELIRAADQPHLRKLDPAIVLLGYGRLRPLLEDVARQRPGRVYLLPPVPIAELLDWVAGADVCYLGCPPLTLNLGLTLPNKVFEAMMAGVPAVAADGTEQARLVDGEGIGRIVDIDQPDQLAGTVASLLTMPAPERASLRAHCRSVALARYSWELRSQPLVELYRRL